MTWVKGWVKDAGKDTTGSIAASHWLGPGNGPFLLYPHLCTAELGLPPSSHPSLLCFKVQLLSLESSLLKMGIFATVSKKVRNGQ